MNIRIIILTVALLVSVLSLAGCNTWEGAGKDIEETGEAMQGED